MPKSDTAIGGVYRELAMLIFVVLGLIPIVAGIWMIYSPAGVIASGVGILVIGYLVLGDVG